MKPSAKLAFGAALLFSAACALAQSPRPSSSSDTARAVDERLNTRVAKRDELWRARNQALADLTAARAAKVNGEEPLPGERTGITSGRARLNDAYWARQDELQKAADRAQQRLERAERALREAGS